MSATKGKIHVPNMVNERVLAIIVALESNEFSTSDVRAHAVDLKRNQVSCVLRRKVEQHELVSLGGGRYRKTHSNIVPLALPNALVADAVFTVLFTDNSPKPRLPVDIAGDAETYVNRPRLSLRGQVDHVLRVWARTGHVQRTGKRGEYHYQLCPHVTERPPMPKHCPPAA